MKFLVYKENAYVLLSIKIGDVIAPVLASERFQSKGKSNRVGYFLFVCLFFLPAISPSSCMSTEGRTAEKDFSNIKTTFTTSVSALANQWPQ